MSLVPTPEEAQESAYLGLLNSCVDKVLQFGMCHLFGPEYSRAVVERVLREFQDAGWKATCYTKEDPIDPSLGGLISIRPQEEEWPLQIFPEEDDEDPRVEIYEQ